MKKMRRMIPALCMLLVSAIMLSTASFAWFTMNDSVTASGVQIQATADASMLISDAPLYPGNAGSGEFKANVTAKLNPIAYKGAGKGTLAGVTTIQNNGWYYPAESKESIIATGANGGTYTAVTDGGENTFYFVQEYYIASAGDAIDTDLQLTLTAPVHQSTGETYLAFSAAIYYIPMGNTDKNAAGNTVWNDGVNPDFFTANMAPVAIIHVDSAVVDDAARNVATIEGVKIPSIAGATDTAPVGAKFVVLYYIDGALMSTGAKTVEVNYGQKYTNAINGKFDSSNTYYSFTEVEVAEGAIVDQYFVLDENGLYVPATYKKTTDRKEADETYFSRDVVAPGGKENGTDITENWYLAAGDVTDNVNYCYVRSADMPDAGSTMQLDFKQVAPEQDETQG